MKPLKVNADYELELFHHKRASPAINHSIEFLLFFLSDRPLYSDKKYSADYLKYVEKLIGRTPQIIKDGPFENYWGPLKSYDKEKWWNSKITSTQLMVQEGWCNDTHILKNETDLEKLNFNRDLLLKDPFGMSGQKFQLLRCEMSLNERQEILLKALAQGPLIVEPWFNRIYDFSQYLFPDGRKIAYQNLVDRNFQYKGTFFNNFQSARLEDLPFYSRISETKWVHFRSQTEVIIDFYSQRPNEYGYSIDSFVYEENGQLYIRAITEINYRQTMGRITYELAEKYSPNKRWSGLLLTKSVPKAPLWKICADMEGIMVLSPGDSRFEIILLKAKNQIEALNLIEKLNSLLPDGQFTIKFE
jgi:hypothetical protein